MNNDLILFDPLFSPVWIAIVATGLLFFFIFKEHKKKYKFRYGRMIALGIATLAVLGLVLRPSMRAVVERRSIAILTSHYDPNDVDSLLRKYNDLLLYRTNESGPFKNSILFTSYHQLESEGAIRFVLGDGLPAYALDALEKKQFQFLPGKKPSGITMLNFNDHNVVNRQSYIKGTFTVGKTASLKLIGPGGSEDSISLKGSGSKPFQLSFFPKLPGKFNYTLEIKVGTNPTQNENLPIDVKSERKLEILFLQEYPNAETRFLKNFLAEKGHHLTIRYQLSKKLYRYEFINSNGKNLEPITSSVLNDFDLIVVDGGTLEALTSEERKTMHDAINKGLGLLVCFNKYPDNKKALTKLLSFSEGSARSDTLQITLLHKSFSLSAIPLRLTDETPFQKVISTPRHFVSGYCFKGLGKIGFQLLHDTYRLALAGEDEAYAALWDPLLEQIARNEKRKFNINITSSFPWYPDEPLNLEVISTDESPELLMDSIPVPLIEDVAIDDHWLGKVWCGEMGWHTLFIKNDSTILNFYISHNGEWSSLRATQKINSNGIEQKNDSTIENAVNTDLHIKQLSPFIFYFIFLVAFGFLWLSPKL